MNLLDAAIKAAEQLRLAVLVIAQEGVCVLQELICLWRAARHILQSDQSYEELVDGIVTLQFVYEKLTHIWATSLRTTFLPLAAPPIRS